jgi:sugar lactone lactonase YvrE
MFQAFSGLGSKVAPVRSMAAPGHLYIRLQGLVRLCLLPLLFLSLTVACSHHSDHSSDPGTVPSISVQPLDTPTVAGRPVTLTVTAAGAPQLRFQWAVVTTDAAGHVDTNSPVTPIFGAISPSFTLYDPQPSDSGRYAVYIVNPNGTLWSYGALVTVAPALNFEYAVALAADSAGNLFVSDQANHCIWKVNAAKQITLLAGSQGLPGSDDGQGAAARFRSPGGLALDPSGNLLVADMGNNTLRSIAPDGTVSTLAGTAGQAGTTDAKGALARFNGPFGLAVVNTGGAYGGVYVSDTQNHTIRFVATDGTVSTYAGLPGQAGAVNGSLAVATFNQPNGLALAPSGILYVADYGNSCVRAIAASGQVSTLAGQPGVPQYIDGTGAGAQFNGPLALTLDGSGNLYLVDTNNHAVRRITPAGVVNVIAGSGVAGNVDGTGILAQFVYPRGITLAPSGNLVVADTGNHLIRQVTPAGVVTTL